MTQKSTDLFTGGPLAVRVDAADRQEYQTYPELMQQAHDAIGAWPQMISGDRGIATKDVYTFNTQRGIGSAIPWRITNRDKDRGDLED